MLSRRVGLWALLATVIVSLALCGTPAEAKKGRGNPHGAPPGQAKKQGNGQDQGHDSVNKADKHKYRYYADAGVYFDPAAKRYYYRDDSGGWKVTVSLPDRIRIKLGEWVTIEAGSRPYREYEEHVIRYPRKHGPPPHAPAHGYRHKFQYRYYPKQGIYYDLAKHRYYRRENGAWRIVVDLPDRIRIKLGEYVNLGLDTDKPYTLYDKHRQEYPPR